MEVVLAPRTSLRLKSPVMAASGTFGYGVEFAARMDLSKLGALVSKGTTREARTGNTPLRMVETAAGMLNAIGLQNVGIDEVIASKAPIWAQWNLPVLVNVSGTSVEDYCYIVSRLNDVPGVSGIELNISCPNVKQGGVAFGSDPIAAEEVTQSVRDHTDLPLIVKLSPNVRDIRSVAVAVERGGADAISLINTVYGMAIDVRQRRSELAVGSGGLSGPAIKPLALHLVYQVAREVSLPIVGVGGIMSPTDALEFILAGATAIQLGTALLVDPTAWKGVSSGIEEWCHREGVKSMQEIIGAANDGFKGYPAQEKTGEDILAG